MFRKKIEKVVCINGHYFDRNRFEVCPVCGAASKSRPGSPMEQQPRRQETPLEKTHALLEEPDLVVSQPQPVQQIVEKSALRGAEKPAAVQEPSFLSFEAELQRLRHEEAAPPVKQEAPAAPLAEQIRQTHSDLRSPLPATVSYYDFDEIVPPVGWLVCIEGPERGKAHLCKAGKNRIGRDETLEISLMQDQTVSRKPQAVVIYDPVNRKFFLQNGMEAEMVYHNDQIVFTHAELQAYDQITVGKTRLLFLPLCGERFSWDDTKVEE